MRATFSLSLGAFCPFSMPLFRIVKPATEAADFRSSRRCIDTSRVYHIRKVSGCPRHRRADPSFLVAVGRTPSSASDPLVASRMPPSSGEREVAGVLEQLARRYALLERIVDLVLRIGEGLVQGGGCLPALAGVRLVNDDREVEGAALVSYLIRDERELLHRADDDFLAALYELAQV